MASFDGESFRKQWANATASAARWRFAMVSALDSTTLLRLVMAFALAAGLWVYVTLRNNPDTTQILRARPIQVRGLTAGLIVTTTLPAADVSVVGPSLLIQDASIPIEPNVDLSGQAPAANLKARVRVDAPRGVNIVSVSPEEVTLDVEELTQAEFPLAWAVPSNLPADVRMDPPQLEPRAVTAAGARSTLAQISRVIVRPEMAGTGDQPRTARPIPVDVAGREVSGPSFTITPASIRLTWPSRAVTGSKSVPIRSNVVGQPAPGYQLDSISTTPAVVTIAGEAAALQNVTALETEPIDIKDRTQTLIQTVRLIIPAGVAAEPTGVQVEIGISAIQARTRLTLTVIARGLGPGLRAQIVPGNVTATIQGPVPQIQAIDVGAMRAEVNLQGYGPGTHQVTAELVGPGLSQLRVVENQPATVTVQISADPVPPTPVATAPPPTAPPPTAPPPTPAPPSPTPTVRP